LIVPPSGPIVCVTDAPESVESDEHETLANESVRIATAARLRTGAMGAHVYRSAA
jgi:hypothetical protein